MDRDAARAIIESALTQPFAEDRFRHLTINLLEGIDEQKAFNWVSGQYIRDAFKDHVRKYRRLGTYTDPEGRKLDLLVVHLSKPWALERSRATQRNFVAEYLKQRGEKDAALIAYHVDDPTDWRFSFVRMQYREEVTEDGRVKVKEEFTPSRRYSFLVGQSEPSHTAQQQLVPLLEEIEAPTLDEIEHTFSVERVTKEFYTDYRGLFEKVREALDAIVEKNRRVHEEFTRQSIDAANFAKKLLGQIVFLYFLQKKGWLGVGRDEAGDFKPWGQGPKNFLRKLYEREFVDYTNFFDDVLEPLFYNALAREHDDDYYHELKCRIPFLNGGLFEPLNDYNWQEVDIHLPNDLIGEVLETFDRYNFTVREDDPLDQEVAVDPEMLGKVFENLLPENLRKGAGSYYTPRNVVHFMCQESLINFLDGAINRGDVPLVSTQEQQRLIDTGEAQQIGLQREGQSIQVPRADLEEFIRRGEFAQEMDLAKAGGPLSFKPQGTRSYSYRVPPTIRSQATRIDEALADIKVCDPAVGSGAFLVGMMHEIVKARSILTAYLAEQSERSPYELKRQCIQNSLHGVDIDPGAVDIAKLRLWLSLVVDEEEYKSIHPLPNLDYKVMQGNSLFEDFHGIALFVEDEKTAGTVFRRDASLVERIEQLHRTQAEYFDAMHPGEKKRLRAAVEDSILEVFAYAIEKKNKAYYEAKTQIERVAADVASSLRREHLAAELRKLKQRFELDPDELEAELRELTHGNVPRSFFPWRLYFADVFQNRGGFDVVIANPPYGLKEPASVRNRVFPDRRQSRDSYGVFVAYGLRLLRSGGELCYIISDTWRTLRSHTSLRELLLDSGMMRGVLAMPPWIFGATVNTCILLYRYAETSALLSKASAHEAIPMCDFTRLPEGDRSLLKRTLDGWRDDRVLTETTPALVEAPALPGDPSQIPVARHQSPLDKVRRIPGTPIFCGSATLSQLIPGEDDQGEVRELGNTGSCHARILEIGRGSETIPVGAFGEIADVKVGLQTDENHFYIRRKAGTGGAYDVIDPSLVLTEDEIAHLSPEEKTGGVSPLDHGGRHFLPYDKGEASNAQEGWLPNYWVPTSYYIDWSVDAVARLRTAANLPLGSKHRAYVRNERFYFRSGVAFSPTGIYSPTYRFGAGTVFDHKSSTIFCDVYPEEYILGYLCSKPALYLLKVYLSHTVETREDALARLPFPVPPDRTVNAIVSRVRCIIQKQQTVPNYNPMLADQDWLDEQFFGLLACSASEIAEVEAWYYRRWPLLARQRASL